MIKIANSRDPIYTHASLHFSESSLDQKWSGKPWKTASCSPKLDKPLS